MRGAEPKLTGVDYAIAGFTSGVMMRACTQPLDVLKIRFQLQIDPITHHHSGSKYHGLRHAVSLIIKEEGVTALWKGHMAGQCLSVVYGAVQFSTFELCTSRLTPSIPNQTFVHFLSGAFAGCVASACAMPLDVLRTRLVAQTGHNVYTSMRHAAVLMFQQEGIKAFYRGFIPTAAQIAPHTGIQFATYRLCQSLANDLLLNNPQNNVKNKNVIVNLTCGAIAGMTAKTIVYPFDMLKKRLQVIGFERARDPFCSNPVPRYRNILHCLRSVCELEGISGFYKGMVPSMLKAVVTSAIGFAVYDQMCTLLKMYHSNFRL